MQPFASGPDRGAALIRGHSWCSNRILTRRFIMLRYGQICWFIGKNMEKFIAAINYEDIKSFLGATSASVLQLSILGFLLRNFIKTRLVNAVKNEYERDLEAFKSKLKEDNDVHVSNLEGRLQRIAEARKIKQDYYHVLLEAISNHLSYNGDMRTQEAMLASKNFCVEINRLPLYASQDVVKFVNESVVGGRGAEFTELYDLIRKDLCSDVFSSFEGLSGVSFQIPKSQGQPNPECANGR